MPPVRRLALLAGAAALPAAAKADLIYSNTFESGVIGPGWSSTAHLEQAPAFSRFMGRFSNNTPASGDNVSLTLQLQDDIGQGTPHYVLSFDLYVIDSWEGEWGGPDRFQVSIDSAVVFSHSFSNTNPPQSYPLAPTVGPAPLGFAASVWDHDSIYRNIQIAFEAPGATQVVINWRSLGLENVPDESWGIDNVNVSSVPTPGSLALLGVAGLTAMRRRRRA